MNVDFFVDTKFFLVVNSLLARNLDCINDPR